MLVTLLALATASAQPVDVSPAPLSSVGTTGPSEDTFVRVMAALRARYADLESVPPTGGAGAQSAGVMRATASSHSRWRNKIYRPSNVLDRDHRTAWVEGVRGHGVGQWLELELAPMGKTAHLRGLIILPGFAKNSVMYTRNSRPRRLLVEARCDSAKHRSLFRLHLDNARRPQVFLFEPAVVTGGYRCALRATVETVYRGTHFKDTSIAELRLLVSR